MPASEANSVRSFVSDGYTDWVLTSVNSSDYYLRMKPSALEQLKKDTVDRSIQTISNRINNIGVTEPTVQQYGSSSDKYEILVELPGVDDPQQVKDMIGTVANLQICDVKDGPFPKPRGRHGRSRRSPSHQHGVLQVAAAQRQ